MSLLVEPEQATLQEAITVLIEHMSPSKVARVLAAWQVGKGDYLATKEKLFQGETVDSLFDKARKIESAE